MYSRGIISLTFREEGVLFEDNCVVPALGGINGTEYRKGMKVPFSCCELVAALGLGGQDAYGKRLQRIRNHR